MFISFCILCQIWVPFPVFILLFLLSAFKSILKTWNTKKIMLFFSTWKLYNQWKLPFIVSGVIFHQKCLVLYGRYYRIYVFFVTHTSISAYSRSSKYSTLKMFRGMCNYTSIEALYDRVTDYDIRVAELLIKQCWTLVFVCRLILICWPSCRRGYVGQKASSHTKLCVHTLKVKMTTYSLFPRPMFQQFGYSCYGWGHEPLWDWMVVQW